MEQKNFMKINLKIFQILISLLFLYVGCSQFENPTDFQSEQSSSSLELKKGDTAKNEKKLRKFAKAMAKALEDQNVRQLLKRKIGEKFDGDPEVLWNHIKNQKINNYPFRNLIDKQMDNEFKIGDIEEIALLNISIPVHFEDWDASSPILVAYKPLTIDDMEAKTIYAFDSSHKEYELDYQKAPDFPVMVIGLNERVDPETLELLYDPKTGKGVNNPSFLSKPTTSSDPKVYFEFFRTDDNRELWPDGSAEILVKVLTGLGKKWEARWCGIHENGWYQKHVFMFYYHLELGRYLSAGFLEDDGGGTMSFSLSVDKAPFKASATFNISTGDDEMGTNELIDMTHGPLNSNQNSHNDFYTAGDARFTLWWVPNDQPVIFNSGFESSGIWEIYQGSSCSYTRTTSQKHSGDYSMFFEDNSPANRVCAVQMAEQIVLPGQLYKAQGYYYHNSGERQRLILQFYDCNNWICEHEVWTSTDPSWNRISVEAIAPWNAVRLKVWVGSHTTTQSSGYWDDISAELLN